jgi:hypothetical protein
MKPIRFGPRLDDVDSATCLDYCTALNLMHGHVEEGQNGRPRSTPFVCVSGSRTLSAQHAFEVFTIPCRMMRHSRNFGGCQLRRAEHERFTNGSFELDQKRVASVQNRRRETDKQRTVSHRAWMYPRCARLFIFSKLARHRVLPEKVIRGQLYRLEKGAHGIV